ncbi:MAG: FAD-binding oxidoreductase, partial [Deltaproteobacteria bacterium]|nr:FAD-binding oxidoreductase [Deltaproteobacteria bacterium]
MGKDIYDVVIIGGGVMGSSTAYHLMKADNRLKVCFVEKDPVYERCSSMLSMANVRVQFGLKENIQISQYTLERLKSFDEDMAVNGEKPAIGHRKEGNLFLVDEQGQAESKRSLALQQSLGCRVEWWSPAKIMEHYPLYKPDCYVGGTFGADDGYLDPYAFVMAYKKKAVSLGATFVKDEVVEILTQGGLVDGVRLRTDDTLRAKVVVNCAGAWAAEIAKTAGIELPVVPTKRQVFCLKPAVKPEVPLPLTLLPSGLYFRSETGGLILLGKSMDEDPIGFDFSWDDKRFYESLWPELAEFVPAFDTLK